MKITKLSIILTYKADDNEIIIGNSASSGSNSDGN